MAIACEYGSDARVIASHCGKGSAMPAATEQLPNPRPSTLRGEQILRSLLDDLERVSKQSEEIFDTDVRERMWDAVDKGFINTKRGYALPNKFGMFSDQGNARVKEALRRFIERATTWARSHRVTSSRARLAAFQDSNVVSQGGRRYDDFFGDS